MASLSMSRYATLRDHYRRLKRIKPKEVEIKKQIYTCPVCGITHKADPTRPELPYCGYVCFRRSF